jgi:hypothetical protein
MEKLGEIVQRLNELMKSDQFDLTEFNFLIQQIKEQLKTPVKFLDFEFYDEARMETARNNKIAMEKIKDFNAAFEFREIERKCLKYSQMKSEFHIEKSSFYLYKYYLLYFCLGTSRHDKFLRDYLIDRE